MNGKGGGHKMYKRVFSMFPENISSLHVLLCIGLMLISLSKTSWWKKSMFVLRKQFVENTKTYISLVLLNELFLYTKVSVTKNNVYFQLTKCVLQLCFLQTFYYSTIKTIYFDVKGFLGFVNKQIKIILLEFRRKEQLNGF